MSQKVSLRLNVKLPSAGLNGQLQRADESIIDNVHEKASPPPSKPDSRQTSPTSSLRSHSARSPKQVSPAAENHPRIDTDIVELNNPIPDLSADRTKTMRDNHYNFTKNKMMTPQSKLPVFLKPVKPRSALSPKAKMLKRDKQQQTHQEALKAVLDLSNGMKNEDENIVWKQSAMQKDAARLKIQRQTIFEKFRMAPNSPSLPSFMLDAPQRSPSSRMGGAGPPIRITSLRTSGSLMARPDSSLARQKAKIAELVESANNSIKTFRKTPKRSSLEKRARTRQRLNTRSQQYSSPSIPNRRGVNFMFTGKR